MVFESLVADLINKYLGDFVENLDRSQLKIGIWGGKDTFTVLQHPVTVE
jgi:vacuolar protein sorting-associated protein 13A/C